MLVLLAVVGGVLFHPALEAPFHFDDHHSIRLNPHLQDPGAIAGFFTDATRFSADAAKAMYRPLVLASYALTWAAVGHEQLSMWLHVENVLLHILAAWLVWQLARPLDPHDGRRAGHRHWPVLAAIGFLVYPLTAETALYVSARSESLSTVLCLLTFLLWRHERRLPAFICYGLALTCKSTALVAPLILWGLERVESPTGRRSTRASMLPFLSVAVVYVVWMQGLIESSLVEQHVRTPAQQLLVQLHAWVYQLRLATVAQPLSVIHPVGTGTFGLSHIGAGGLLVSLAWLLAGSSRRRWAVVAALSPLLIPSLVPLHTVVSEHRLYLTVAVTFVVAARMAGTTRWRVRWRWPAVVLGLWALITLAQALRWQSEEQVWLNAARVAPGSARVHEFLGDVLRRQDRPDDALIALQQADRLYGGRLETQLSMSGILLQQNKFDEAGRILASLQSQYPDRPEVLYNLALARRRAAPDQALALLEQALSHRPEWLAARMEWSLLLEEAGRGADAAAGLRNALGRNENWLEGWINLGFIEARQGNYRRARSAWDRAAKISPAEPMIRQNLAELDRIEALPASDQ